MSCTWEQLNRHIFHSAFLHALENLLHPFSSIAHRIVLTGDQQNRQAGIQAIIFVCASGPFHGTKQFPEQARRNVLAHQRISQILAQFRFIGSEPISDSAVGLEFLIVITERKLPHQIGSLVKPGLFDLPFYNTLHD